MWIRLYLLKERGFPGFVLCDGGWERGKAAGYPERAVVSDN